ncbi:hypothetical protein Smp_002500 [Schistosoma mansoni]|uniref:hypothetical protein n=1 Tax=Schistosoma mansoni TaxID=6183 RepID=UPI0001A63B26|nr:hypothetical protein Smp_002500 [Schistosoma mansoni]|eukprot:XP_018651178.1 hypothetical protein Smp_002500 [Schistosoma mansoni]
MSTEKNHKTDQIPELSPHHPKTPSNDKFEGNCYRVDSLLELELATVRLGQTEREIYQQSLNQRGRENYGQAMASKMSYHPTSARHGMDSPSGTDWIITVSKA